MKKAPVIKDITDLSKFSFKDAMKEYEKMKYTTSYGQFYGRKPALEDLTDISILRSQKFSHLPCTKILTRTAKQYLDSWQSIEKEDDYMGLVLSTLRSLNTYVLK